MAISRPRSRGVPLLPLLLFLLAPLIYSVSRLQLSWAPEGALNLPPSAAPKRPDHLVLGPVSGQGRPDRLQCQGLKSVNKISLSSERNYSGEHVSFVTVFTTYNSDPAGAGKMSSDVVTVGKHSYSKVERSMAILNIFISFIQVSMPKSNVIILTDPNSKFSINRGSAAILPIKGNYSRGNLMLQRIRSYIAFLEQKLVALEKVEGFNNFVFTDSDIAVVDDLGHIFKRYPHCDIALTFRNNKGQPLNSGFVAVRGTRDGISKAVEFFKEVLEAYNLKYMKASHMLGDQLALAWVVKSHLPSTFGKFSRHEAFTGEVNGASILFLPCAVYNWTPPEGAGQFHGMPLDVKPPQPTVRPSSSPATRRPANGYRRRRGAGRPHPMADTASTAKKSPRPGGPCGGGSSSPIPASTAAAALPTAMSPLHTRLSISKVQGSV